MVVGVFLFQMRFCDDRDVDLVSHHIRRQVLYCMWFSDGSSIKDVQKRRNITTTRFPMSLR